MEAMKLQDFVSGTLKQIVNGVKEAQAEIKEAGAQISPDSHLNYDNKKHLFCAGKLVELVEFDVAVITSETKETKSGLGIFVAGFGVGARGDSGDSSISTSRIKFSVPLVLPSQ
jgi:hypothetical protein